MPPPADAVNEGLQLLNWMLGSWNKKRWLVYRIADLSTPATGALSYAIGPGALLDSVGQRPAKIYYAFARWPGANASLSVDYQLRMVNSREDYSRIRLKSLTSWPTAVYYDPTLPNGAVYFWPLPQAPFELHVGVLQVLLGYSTLNDLLSLPDEYTATIYYNLVVRYAAKYRIQADPVMVALARDALNTLREANIAVSTLRLPAPLKRRGSYNIYSDNN